MADNKQPDRRRVVVSTGATKNLPTVQPSDIRPPDQAARTEPVYEISSFFPAQLERPAPNWKPASSPEQLGKMPLSVLLPKVGDIHTLARSRSKFAARLAELRERDPDENREDGKVAVLEESMLSQVMQWLDAGSGSGEG